MNARISPNSMTGDLADIAWSVAHEPVTSDAIQAATRLVQHALGVCVAGCSLHPARVARASIGSAAGPCTVFGSSDQHEAQDAAFANAVSGHASLLEDSGPGGPREGSHPGAYVFPAALAIAEQEGASGYDLVHAVCAGYETVSQLGEVFAPAMFEQGFRPIAMLGPFGAAAAAGALGQLSRDEMATSFAIAANLASGFNQGFVEGTMEPYFHPAFAARNGILAARLAAAGSTASRYALEGDRGMLAAFGGSRTGTPIARRNELAVCRVGTKRFATCLYNQGTLALIRKHFPDGIDPGRLGRVQIARPLAGSDGTRAPGVASAPPYTTPLARQMSARFTAAAALLGRPVESAHYYETAATDVAVNALAARIELASREADGIHIVIELVGGLATEIVANGELALEFSTPATLSQFAARVRPVAGERFGRLVEMIADLPRLDNVRRLTAELRSCWLRAHETASHEETQ